MLTEIKKKFKNLTTLYIVIKQERQLTSTNRSLYTLAVIGKNFASDWLVANELLL